MEEQVLYAITWEDTFMWKKKRFRFELYKDFMRLSESKYINQKREFQERDLCQTIEEARYEDIVSYTDDLRMIRKESLRLHGGDGAAPVDELRRKAIEELDRQQGGDAIERMMSKHLSINFYGSVRRMHGKSEEHVQCLQISVVNHVKEYEELVRKIQEVTPIRTLSEKKAVCPAECFGRIMIHVPNVSVNWQAYVDMEYERDVNMQNGVLALTEPFGKHLVQVRWLGLNATDSADTSEATEQVWIELNAGVPVVTLRKKGNRLIQESNSPFRPKDE